MKPPGRTVVAATLLAVALSASACNRAPEADCQKVGPDLLAQIQRTTSSSLLEAFAVPSRTQDGVWLVGANTERGVAVWSTSLTPNGEGLSFVLNANQPAIDDSVVGVDVPPDSDQPEAKATQDKAGIAAAEACVTKA